MSIISDLIPNVGGVSDVLWYAIIIAASTTVSPLLLSHFTNKNARADRAADWARQDAIAEKAEKTARLLVESNAKIAGKVSDTAALLTVHNAKIDGDAKETVKKLDVIHTLVNSNMTAAMKSELEATQRELILMKEVIALHSTAGQKPSTDAIAAVKVTEAKIAELTATLRDRLAVVEGNPDVKEAQEEAKAKEQE